MKSGYSAEFAMKSRVTRQIEPIRCVRTGFMSIPSPKRPDLLQTPAGRADAPFQSTPILAVATTSRRVTRAKKRIPRSSAGSLTPHLKCECQSSSSFDKMGPSFALRGRANDRECRVAPAGTSTGRGSLSRHHGRPARTRRACAPGGRRARLRLHCAFFWVGACHG
ncbi:hypothetical protein C6P98_23925 [Burkholderia multivorans]|uniref:Uncharacterized protein n=1 Tax=Burkholderia multivorans TaxID=87883 RepID=A0A8E2RSA7_9BURK|nr:hypothetical protein C6P98_23925 [Burkholderia multivorans]